MRLFLRVGGAVATLSLLCSVAGAQLLVVSEDFESLATGPYGAVSDFSDAPANSTANIVAGQALEFSFDVNSGAGALNTNVQGAFQNAAMNNASPNIANYTLEFDAAISSGTNTGWFGVVELATPGSGPRTLGFDLGAMTPGGPAVHHSASLADMGQPFGSVIDPTQSDWVFRVVALGFPADGGGARTTLIIDNIRVTSVPEPASASVALLGVAAAGTFAAAKRRRARRGSSRI